MTKLPLCRSWERVATRELVETLFILTSGSFTQPNELSAKLKDLIISLEVEYSSPGIEDEAQELFEDIMHSLRGGEHDEIQKSQGQDDAGAGRNTN